MPDMLYGLLCLVMLGTLQGCSIEPASYGPPPYRHHHYAMDIGATGIDEDARQGHRHALGAPAHVSTP